MEILKKDRESLTAAIYHQTLAMEFFGTYLLDCTQKAKGLAINWHRKAEWLVNDVFANLDPASRDLFRREVTKGDPLFLSAIANHLLAMNAEQRALMEKIAEAVAGGEELEYIESPDKKEP